MPPPPVKPMQYKKPGNPQAPPPPVPKPMPKLEAPTTTTQAINVGKRVSCLGDLPPPPPRGQQLELHQQQIVASALPMRQSLQRVDGGTERTYSNFSGTAVSSLSGGSPEPEHSSSSLGDDFPNVPLTHQQDRHITMPPLEAGPPPGRSGVRGTAPLVSPEAIATMTLQGVGDGSVPYGERADITQQDVDILTIQLSELVRENRLNAKRLAEFYSPKPSTNKPDGDGSDGICTADTPVSLLLARIQRLELALQLESIQREELETRNQAQLVEIALMTKRITMMKQHAQQQQQQKP